MRHAEPARELWSSLHGLRRVVATRLARAAAGGVGLGALLWAAARPAGVTVRVLAAAVLTLVSFAAVRLLVPRALGRDRFRLRRWGRRLEAVSLALPMAIAALLVPLGVHLGCFRVAGFSGLADFDAWIRQAVWQAGLAWAVLGALVVHFAVMVPTLPTESVREASETARVVTCLAVVAAGAVPGLWSYGIPTFVIAFTAALTIPPLFAVATWLIESERVTLK